MTVQPPAAVYKPGDTLDLTAKNPWLADDTNPAIESGQRNLAVRADNVVEAVNSDGSFVDLSQAQVSYSSSNDSVARVSSAGVLTAEAPGVATISVTVDGVTGSAVIAVRRPLSLVTPAVARPGSTFTATETLLNTGSSPMTGVSLTLATPERMGCRADLEHIIPVRPRRRQRPGDLVGRPPGRSRSRQLRTGRERQLLRRRPKPTRRWWPFPTPRSPPPSTTSG